MNIRENFINVGQTISRHLRCSDPVAWGFFLAIPAGLVVETLVPQAPVISGMTAFGTYVSRAGILPVIAYRLG